MRFCDMISHLYANAVRPCITSSRVPITKLDGGLLRQRFICSFYVSKSIITINLFARTFRVTTWCMALHANRYF